MKRLSLGILALSIACAACDDAWAQRGGGRGFGRGGGGDTGLLMQESVQAELKLSDEQKTQLADHATKQREAASGLQDLSREERREKFAEFQKSSREEIAKILNEDQAKRLKQISLQQRGASALGDPDVATAVGLSDEQKTKVESLGEELRGAMRDAFQGGGDDRDAIGKKLEAMRTDVDGKLQGLLSPDQQGKWKALLGEPFKGEIRRPQFRGGRPGGDSQSAMPTGLFRLASFKADDDDKDDKQAGQNKGDDGDRRKADKARKGPGKQAHTGGQQGDRARHAHHAHHGRYAQRAHHAAHAHHARHGQYGHRGTFEHHLAGPRQRGPHAEIWAHIAAATGQHRRWHHGPGSAFGSRGPMAWHGRHPPRGPEFAHRHGPAFDRHRGPHGPDHFAAHRGPHGPAHFTAHHHAQGPHHFASWRRHDPEQGPRHFERPTHDGHHEPGMPPRRPRDDRSQSDRPGQRLTDDGDHPSREAAEDRLAQLERTLDRLTAEIENLRRALRR